ncbi:hypothetical protein EAI_11582, partial [Harpegnathos saltator]
NIAVADENVENAPQMSIRRHAQQTNLSYSTTPRILTKD